MMSKLVLIILLNFSISRNFSFGGKLCNHYDDEHCMHPDVIKNGHFVNQWSVHLPGLSKEQARRLLEDNGFEYLGKIMDGVDLHLVTKTDTPEKHAMPNKKVIELLKRHEQVNSVAQKHVIHRSPDEVYNIINEKRVYCQSLNPDEIKLNDGRENFERIMGRKIKMEKDVESHAVKPIPNNEKEENEDNKNLPSESSKTSSELANEYLMEMDLPDENLTAEDFSDEIVPMEYSPRKTSSSIRIMTKHES